MSLLPLLSFLAFSLYTIMGIIVLVNNPRARLNRLFCYVCFAFAVWSFAFALVYTKMPESSVWFWYRVSSIGWIFFPVLGLRLFLELAHYRILRNRFWLQMVAFIPPLVFLYQVNRGNLFAVGFEYGPWGNVEILDGSTPWFWLYFCYAAGYMVIGLIAALTWRFRAKNRFEKKQALAIIITVSISVVSGFFFNMILPLLCGGKSGFPNVAQILGLIWLGGFAVAIRRYRLVEITPEIAADEIISNIVDTVLLLNPDGTVRKMNRSAEILLGYPDGEMKNRRFWEIFERGENARYKMLDIQKSMAGQIQWEDWLRPKKGKPIPMNCFISCVKAKTGEDIGLIFIGQDLRLVKKLEKEIKKSEIAERKLQKSKEGLEEKVAERTRELEMFATTDPLTGVYNRRIGFLFLEEEIHKAKRNKSVLTVCFLDINGLKTVNDNYGHREGDELILSVVSALKENLRGTDILCRMGGDEFLIIMLDCNMNQSLEVWDNVQKSIDERNERKQKPYLLSVSRGFAEYNPIYPMTLDELITTADYQMYQFKKRFKKIMDGE